MRWNLNSPDFTSWLYYAILYSYAFNICILLLTFWNHSSKFKQHPPLLLFHPGKHNGCVQGVRYFTCKPKHGIFVRPDRLCPTTVDSCSDEQQYTKHKSSLRQEGKNVISSGDAKRHGGRKATSQNKSTKRWRLERLVLSVLKLFVLEITPKCIIKDTW